jgi:hypothetical protein
VNGGVLYSALGEGRISPIDVHDIASFGARVLTDPASHAGKVYTITGPESISMREAASTLDVPYQAVTPEDVVSGMLAAGVAPWIAEVSGEYMTAYSRNWGDYATPDFASVMGRRARGFAEFARDNAALLGLG